jgi:hypothetical protein
VTESRQPVPPGVVSSIEGRRQAPALRIAAGAALLTATGGLVLPGDLGDWLSVAAVATVTATPLLRVAWLIFRWVQERDWRFVALGIGILVVVLLAAGVAIVEA